MNTRKNCDEAEQDGVGSGPGAGDAARSSRKVVRGRQVLGSMRRGKEKISWCHNEWRENGLVPHGADQEKTNRCHVRRREKKNGIGAA